MVRGSLCFIYYNRLLLLDTTLFWLETFISQYIYIHAIDLAALLVIHIREFVPIRF